MLNVLFFAKIKEDLQCGQESLEWSHELTTVKAIKVALSARGEHWQSSLSSCLCAVNHAVVPDHHVVQDGDEVAFFPPVTGG